MDQKPKKSLANVCRKLLLLLKTEKDGELGSEQLKHDITILSRKDKRKIQICFLFSVCPVLILGMVEADWRIYKYEINVVTEVKVNRSCSSISFFSMPSKTYTSTIAKQ